MTEREDVGFLFPGNFRDLRVSFLWSRTNIYPFHPKFVYDQDVTRNGETTHWNTFHEVERLEETEGDNLHRT